MVAVVGTLLAMLVFFTLFGVFLTQYVPLWMEENENEFSNSVQASLATLKSGVDDQYILGDIPSYSVPVTVSSQAVPLIAQPTVATLSYLTGCPGGFYATNGSPEHVGSCDFERLNYTTAKASGQAHSFNETSPTNYLQVSLPDRYYTAVTYFFESDSVFGAQGGGRQWTVVPPPLNVTNSSGNVTVRSSMLVLVGNASSFTGQGSKDISSQLITHTNVSSAGRFLTSGGAQRPFNVTITLGVHDVCSWYGFLYNESYDAFSSASTTHFKLTWTGLGVSGAQTTAPTLAVCASSVGESYDLTLTVYHVSFATAYVAQDELGFNAGGL